MALTIHFQVIPSWYDEFVDRCRGKLEYVVGVDVFPKRVDVKVLGRTYLPDSESNELVNRGAAGADAWVNKFATVYSANPHVHKWIGPNEYVLWDQTAVDKFNAFHVRFIEYMSALGHEVICGQINTGWPRLRTFNDPPPYPETLKPTLEALCKHSGWLSLHEYGPGDMRMGAGAYCLRYSNVRRELIEAGITNLPNFYISETGIDVPTSDPGSDFGHWGWKHFTDWPGYLEQLKWYSGELDKDPYIEGASIFTVGNWPTFNLEKDNALELADFIASGVAPPVVKYARLLDVNQFSGSTINWPLVKADGYVGVLIRVSGPDAFGTTLIVDEQWENNYAGAAAAGFLIGGYHGLMQEPTGQAKLFVDTVADRPLELGYWADFEGAVTDSKANAFLFAADRNLAEWGVERPICDVYTSAGWIGGKEAAWAAGRNLWVASWTYDLTKGPVVPAQWADWKFWQWSNQGNDVPGIEKRVCLDVYNGGNREFYQEYGDSGGDMWESVGFEDVELVGVTRERFDGFWGVNMKRFVPTGMQSGDVYYKLVGLSWREGWCGLNLMVIDENGNGIEGEQVFQGWRDGDILPSDVAPLGGQPSGYPNQGGGGFTNGNGVHGWGWGSGEWFDPTEKEGPHWYWRGGENGFWSDVVCGFGWWDEHEVLEPTFMRVIVDEPTPPIPTPGGKYKVTGTITLDLTVEVLEE